MIKWFMVTLSVTLERGGLTGYLLFLGFFCGWVLLTLPTTPLEIVASYVYGFRLGTCTGVLGKTAGSTIGFLIGKAVGRRLGWVMPAVLQDYWGTFDRAPLTCLLAIRCVQSAAASHRQPPQREREGERESERGKESE